MNAAKISVDVTAEKLGRRRSAISSELKRNTFDDPEMRELTGYYGLVADTKSKGLALPSIQADVAAASARGHHRTDPPRLVA